MQTKLIEILSSATDWMTAAQIAEKGNWRSAANVGVALQQMEKGNGSVTRRKSPTVKMSNGMPATEWKLHDNQFSEPVVEQDKPVTAYPNSKSPALPPPLPIKAVKALDRNGTAMPDSGDSELASLREKVAELTLESTRNNNLFLAAAGDLARINKRLDLDPDDGGAEPILEAIIDMSNRQEQAEGVVSKWLELAGEFECKTIPELRVFIGATLERVESLRLAKSENVALKTLNESMPGFGAAHQALSKGPFVIRIPGKPAVFTNKYDNAKAAAMSAARQKRGGEVFALIPVGKAIRGAEWKGA